LGINARSFSHQRRRPDEIRHSLLELGRRASVHVRRDGAWIDGIHGGPFTEFACPSASHGFERSFSAAVDGLCNESETAANARNVDDPSRPVFRQIWHGGLYEKQRSTHVDVVLKGKVFCITILDDPIHADAGVVDDDVDLELAALRLGEVVLCHFYDMCWACLATHVGLDDECLDGVTTLELFREALYAAAGGFGSIIHDEVGSFRSEVFTYGGADAWSALLACSSIMSAGR